MDPIIAALAGHRVWDAESAFETLRDRGIVASRRTAERHLHRLGIWPDSLNPDTLRDKNDQPPDARLVVTEMNQARAQRHLALFVQRVSIPNGPVCLHTNDARGARRWIALTSDDQDGIASALQALQESIGKPVLVFAHRSLHRICSRIKGIAGVQIAQVSFECEMPNWSLPKPSDGSHHGDSDAVESNQLCKLENTAIQTIRNSLGSAGRGELTLDASKECAVFVHLLRKAHYPDDPSVAMTFSLPAASREMAAEAASYVTELHRQLLQNNLPVAPDTDTVNPLSSDMVLKDWPDAVMWQYIAQENIPVCTLYFARRRALAKRAGQWMLVDPQFDVSPSDKLRMRWVRFSQPLGYPLSNPIDSNATDLTQLLEQADAINTRVPGSVHTARNGDLSLPDDMLRIHTLAVRDESSADLQCLKASRAVFLIQRVSSHAGNIVFGTVAGVPIACGDHLIDANTGQCTTVQRIITFERTLSQASPGRAVALEVQADWHLSAGDILCSPGQPLARSDHLEATVYWRADAPGIAGRTYRIRLAGQQTGAAITLIKHRIEPDIGSKQAQRTMTANNVYVCTVSTESPVVFDALDAANSLNRFELIDRDGQQVLASGLVRHGLRRGTNLHHQSLTISRADRERINRHAGCVVWFTGLSGSGKSTIANALEIALHRDGRHTYILDGDNIRLGLNKDLGFTDADRVENIRRIAEVARLMMDAGLIVMTSFISPFAREREMAKDLIGDDNFIEVHVDTPLQVCEQRDFKGLYKKARRGELPNMTGIDSPYEPPTQPAIRVSTEKTDIARVVAQIRELTG